MTDARPELNVLALNSGSSSLKFGLYRIGSSRTQMLLSGEAEAIGEEEGRFQAQDAHKATLLSETISIPNQQEALIRIGRLLAESRLPAPTAIGHRIVHGGPKLRQHCLIDDSVVRRLQAASAFAAAYSNGNARLAIEMFCYSVRKQVAAMIAAPIRSAPSRTTRRRLQRVLRRHFLRCRRAVPSFVEANNPISGPASRCSVLVLASQEDEQIARHTCALFPKSRS